MEYYLYSYTSENIKNVGITIWGGWRKGACIVFSCPSLYVYFSYPGSLSGIIRLFGYLSIIYHFTPECKFIKMGTLSYLLVYSLLFAGRQRAGSV